MIARVLPLATVVPEMSLMSDAVKARVNLRTAVDHSVLWAYCPRSHAVTLMSEIRGGNRPIKRNSRTDFRCQADRIGL